MYFDYFLTVKLFKNKTKQKQKKPVARLSEVLLSRHLYDVIIRAVPAIHHAWVSVRLRQRGPQEAGGGVGKMREETGRRRVGVGHGEAPRP